MIPFEYEQRANFFRVAASLLNFGFKDSDVLKLVLLMEGVEKKGGEFSLDDAFKIMAKVDDHYRLKAEKKAFDEQLKKKEGDGE